MPFDISNSKKERFIMKKLVPILISFVLLSSNLVFAADSQNIVDKLSDIWLSPTEDSAIVDNIKKVNQEKIDEDIALYSITPETYRQKIGISADDEKMKEQVRKNYEVYPDNILKVYYLNKNDYANQYAKSGCLEYLISDDYFLIMKGFNYKINDYNNTETVTEWSRRYGSDGTIESYEQFTDEYGYSGGLSDGYCEFLKNSNEIENILNQNNISHIDDVKVVVTGKESTCLYIKSLDNEYLIRLYTGQYYNSESDNPYNKDEDWVEDIALYKLYNAKDFFKTVADKMGEMNEVKPTYDTEAESLQANGLLKGNENGLDLLKPLTRIEATAILVRAMGYEDVQTSEISYFTDIQSDNWGAKYANIAKDKGIASGVGDDMFAPNDTITASQFATLILRNMGENPDWQTAINTFVERGLITSEQADKMDLFTRGDMAKIIYEAKQINMF